MKKVVSGSRHTPSVLDHANRQEVTPRKMQSKTGLVEAAAQGSSAAKDVWQVDAVRWPVGQRLKGTVVEWNGMVGRVFNPEHGFANISARDLRSGKALNKGDLISFAVALRKAPNGHLPWAANIEVETPPVRLTPKAKKGPAAFKSRKG